MSLCTPVGICLLLVTIFQYSVSVSALSSDILNTSLSSQPACKGDATAIRQLCDISEKDIDNNLVLLECLERVPNEVKISEGCENLVWNFKLEVTRTDHFLSEAKRLCGGEELCGHEAESEPGHLLACLVGKRHEVKNIQCGQFLTLVLV